MLRGLKFFMIVILFVISLVACSAEETSLLESEQVKKVKVSSPILSAMGEPQITRADIIPSQEAKVISDIDGTIVGRNLEIGQRVNKGDVLFTIENKDIDLAISKANLDKEKANVQLNNAQSEYESSINLLKLDINKLEQQKDRLQREFVRITDLFESGFIPQKDLEEIEDQVKHNDIELQQLNQSLIQLQNNKEIQLLELQLKGADIAIQDLSNQREKKQVLAPISGIVVDIQGNVGSKLHPGQILAKIEVHEPLYVQVEIAEDELPLIGSESTFIVQVPVLREEFEAELLFISPSTQGENRGYRMELKFIDLKDSLILPGMRAQLVLSSDRSREVMVVPNSALLEEDEQYFVFTLHDEKVKRSPVEIGRRNKEYVEIVQGIHLEDLVVIVGQSQLEDDDLVEILE